MTVTDFAGLAGGLAGGGLFLGGLAVALLAALRIVLVLRRPGGAPLARAIVAGAVTIAAAGAGLFWAAELLPFRRAVDRAAPGIAAVAVLVGIAVSIRSALARRRAAARDAGGADVPPGPAAGA